MNKVYLIDCMEFMKDKPDNYYELAIVDPPYGIGESFKKRENNPLRWHNPKKKIHNPKEWDKKTPDKKYFAELFRISKNQIIWGGNYFVEYLKGSMGWVYWDKKNGDSDYSDGELAFTSFKKGLRSFSFLWQGFQKGEKTVRIHPTQKPIALYKWLLENYAKETDCKKCGGLGYLENYAGYENNIKDCKKCNGRGTIKDKIFDTHVGSGSSRIACYELGYDFEGCEIDKDYWEAQEKRFKAEKARIDNEFYLDDQGLFGGIK